MLCDRAEELLSAFLDEELPSHESLSLERHLRACPACTVRLGELREVQAILASLEEVVPPQGFSASLHERLIAATPARVASVVPLAPRRAARRSAGRWFAAAAAAAVMAASAGSYYLQTARTLPVPPQLVAVDDTPGGINSTGPIGPVNPGSTAPQPGDKVQPTPGTSDGLSSGGKAQSDATQPGAQPAAGQSDAADGLQPPAPTPRDSVGIATQPGTTGSGQRPPAVAPPASSQEQSPLMVYQAEYQVQTANPDEGLSRLVTLSQDLNGTFLSVGNSRLDNGTPISIYVIGVPYSRYQEARSGILAIGPTLTVSESGPRDVTAEANALRRDMDSLLSQEKQLRTQLAAATSDGESSQISVRLSEVLQQITDKQARLEQLHDQARLATFRVTLVQQ